ncbi:TauD/TfdA family dioxygenase [Vibrio sp. AND4]|uniref:TauD/TfdA dioxygenase family protein n=1 Tax=Vibrio sp. AND4 TaxID=314289 RepID=UPI00015F0329|nr:TauD/TfdA family dioxygenase [Vibrio sp. AND4]EDP58013.1 Probable taurine catabolism dioxygenase [Vibrio sp. AND4]
MIEIEKITPNIGACIHGVDLSTCKTEDLKKVYQALIDHQVVFFDNQRISPDQQLNLAKFFGELEPAHPFFPRVESTPQVSIIETTKGNAPLESYWHTDLTWRENPSKGAILHAKHVPDAGGDTIWVSMTSVFDALDDAIKMKLRNLSATHSLTAFEDVDEEVIELDWHHRLREVSHQQRPVIHPVVKVHPETGKETLFINEQFTRCINEMRHAEGSRLLKELFAVARQPEHQVRFKWQKGSLAIWDNRTTQHYAVIDYGDQPRKMHRVTFV